MYFGVCYYPEHWPEEQWESDVELMKDAGFNVVRMGEFAWTRIESEEGQFDFEWLDKIIKLCGCRGIKTILGTPTAAPPKWLIDKHPEICPVDYKGNVMGYGHRRYYCFNSKVYRYYAGLIVEKMAEHYSGNKNVIAWQVDNEFGCGGTTRCYCDNCLNEFKLWLKNKYGSLDALNESWGTVFSSQTYGSWDEIILPGYCALNIHNPSLSLDYRRFASENAKAPGTLITHNFMGGLTDIDYFKLGRELDIVSLGIYPNATRAEKISPINSAIQLDAVRGIKNRNYWILEQQSGTPGGAVMYRTPKPGELRKWTYQSIARGADCIVYFRFKTCLFGVEEYWHGIIDHSGIPGRKYDEVKRVGNEIKKFSGLIEDSSSGAEIALVRSYDICWTFEIQPHVQNYKYSMHLMNYYKPLFKNNFAVDVVSLDCDFSAYKVVIIPNLIMAPDIIIKKIYDYVNSGGCVILDFRTGAKKMDNRMMPMGLPGKYKELLGIEIEDYGILLKEEYVELKNLWNGKFYKGYAWYDVINPKTAGVIAVYNNDYFYGKAAVTRNPYGKGEAYYIGTEADDQFIDMFIKSVLSVHEINPLLQMNSDGIEVIQRVKDGRRFYFIINHSQKAQKIFIDGTYRDILTGKTLTCEVDLLINDVIMIERISKLKSM